MVKEIADDKFEEEVLKSDQPVAVDFWAPWCGPCKILGPVFEKVSNDTTGVKFVKMNVDDNQKYAQEYGVMSIPTILFMKGGEEVDRAVGAVSEDQLKEKVNALK